ncbi:coiled-coil domain-containing protein 9 isoform X2 [Hyperolius riggenbachi]|uniref:coiled-coil domain-containing protein 9 isoform X2 n=1 Tax=Hyperolius riggenbachi TaxID=752182 RepID=UPI0035A2E9B1
MASVVDLKSKEEKDAELDRKIEALRKKNEAIVRRHQLIEEDRKRAEQEGIAVTTPRKARGQDHEPDKARKEKENFSITLDVAAGEKRIVNERRSPKGQHTPPRIETSPRSPTQRSPTQRTSGRTGPNSSGRVPHVERHEEQFKSDGDPFHPDERPARGRRGQAGDGPKRSPRIPREGLPGEPWTPTPRGGRGSGRGRGGGPPTRGLVEATSGPDKKVMEWEERRRQNIEKMNEEMEKIAEYERSQRDGVREKNPIRNFLDDPRRSGPIIEIDRKEGSRRHIRNWGGQDFEKVKTGMDREKEGHVRRPGAKNHHMDMTMSMTGRERAEYMRWKQEREQIDQERLARHRKPTGQWRREWDAEKTDTMFKEGAAPPPDDEPMGRRDQGKKGAPKPLTMAEFLPEGLRRSDQKRDHKRGRGRNKPYNMHDSRWEEEEEEEEVIERVKTLSVEEEKETCVEKVEQQKNKEPEKTTTTVKMPVVNIKKEVKNDEKAVVEIEPEEEEDDEDEGDDDEEWTDASADDGSEVDEDLSEASKEVAASPKEQRLPQQKEAPKLAMPPPNMNSEEETFESNPTTPFSPDGYNPVTDWGEEMEMLSPPGSSNEDSPPQAANRRLFTMDSMSHSDSTQNSQTSTMAPEGIVKSSVDPISLSEVQTDQKQELPEKSPGDEPLADPSVLPLERECDSSMNQGEKNEEVSTASKETSLPIEETSPAQEQTTAVVGESPPVTEETAVVAEESEGAVKAVHIADYETSTEMPQSSSTS